MNSASLPGVPWGIQFFQCTAPDGAPGSCPTSEFLDSVPPQIAAEIESVLRAVADAPPFSFKGGGKWISMHGKMKGLYEVRCSRENFNYRLLCVLVKKSPAFDGSATVCLGGLTKPKRTKADDRDYDEILDYRSQFGTRPSVA